MLQITELSPDDRHEWESLWAGYLEFYRHALSPEMTQLTFERLLDPNVRMWGAIARTEAGVAVGIVHWLSHASTWSAADYVYLEDLFVAPTARGGGVGRALIDHVTGWARERGLPKVYWQTAADNATARRLYDQLASSEFVVYEVDTSA